ncbi:metalloregulator ArsR/SmtB family transcription factor [Ancylomarina sp. 16SWW S1-10-2]|uniref:ArsR/SmtB family transcription factor n=1 Tax=Ancylomarina sp. 16SWW S1-10-2 TaxID=2499681 RepID=UPI0012AE3771|nr:metalloregulator ArsR/SmtB family transcription factor [Ancylomarina sp. 16SWW S1-10-2]MRT93646.1 ArsR family transcriptional regulator [Ancylomarina sp. 16SWW S1-10-2]
MIDYIKIFKALSDIKRLKIIWLLTNIDEKICVSEIVEVLQEPQYNVSRHLKILKDALLINEVREGKWVFYYLSTVKSDFQIQIQKVISSIPEKEMTKEINKCRNLLSTRGNYNG